MNKQRTDKQNEASRSNGAKSNGPVTAEGKVNSAQNGTRHNLCSGHLVLLSNEDPREFHHHMNHYLRRFAPLDGVELDLVHKMIAASWREKRITAMETSLFELEMDRQSEEVDDEFDEISPAARQVLALFGTSDTKAAAALLQRYGSNVRRAYVSAFRILRELQGDRFNRTPEAVRISHGVAAPVSPDPTVPVQSKDTPAAPAEPAAQVTQASVFRRRAVLALTFENNELPTEPKHATAGAYSAAAILGIG